MDLKVFLLIGTVLMFITMMYIRNIYDINLWKTVVCSVMLTFAGVFGTQILFCIETGGSWGGTSFFGAVFFTPLLMALVALVIRVPVTTVLDMSAPAECIMLALMKVRCLQAGCCIGKLLYADHTVAIRFPSQIAEMINSTVLMVVLIWMIKNMKYTGKIYAWYMILYGMTRFVLNLFRETEPFVLGISAGNFWSIISIILGISYLFLSKRKIFNNCYDN